jgi:CheY-like chemotaxis protein
VPKNKKKILIIDDDRLLSRVLIKRLSREGFEAKAAKDGRTGLQAALSSHPDLILLDIVMPVMDGLTVLESLRADPWGKKVPIIILSNLDEAETSASNFGQVQAYLVKSNWSLEDLVQVVRKKLINE